MNCDVFHQALETSVEQRTPLSAEAESHAHECCNPACQESWEEWKLLSGAISAWKNSRRERVELADHVLLRCRETPARNAIIPVRSRQVTIGAAIATAVAAAGILVALTVSLAPSRNSHDVVTPAARTHSPAETSAQSTELQLKEVGTLYVGWMEGASQQVTGLVASMLLPDEDPKPAAGSRMEWLKGWDEQLKPLEETLKELTAEGSAS